MRKWNDIFSPQKFYESSSATNYAYAESIPTNDAGLFVVKTATSNGYHRTLSFDIIINTRLVLTMYKSEIKISVFCHELGHAIGLLDLSSGTAIMNVNRDRATLYTPQADDIIGAIANWDR
jgi:hypothetical protein